MSGEQKINTKNKQSLIGELEVTEGQTQRVDCSSLLLVVGVIADLSSSSSEPLPPVDVRQFSRVTAASFETFMRFTKPRVQIQVPDITNPGDHLDIILDFRSLTDFSPASIAERIPSVREHIERVSPQQPVSPCLLDSQLALILEHKTLRQLINSWIGLHVLVNQLPTDGKTIVRVLNASKREVAKTLKKFKGTAWDQSPLFKMLYEAEYGTPGGWPYNCVIGDFSFDQSPGDVELLSCMAQIASAGHFSFVAAAAPTLLQVDSWENLNPSLDWRLQMRARS